MLLLEIHVDLRQPTARPYRRWNHAQKRDEICRQILSQEQQHGKQDAIHHRTNHTRGEVQGRLSELPEHQHLEIAWKETIHRHLEAEHQEID